MAASNLPFSMSPLDAVSLIWFVVAWGGYNLVIDRILVRTGGLNSQMQLIRESWMRQMFARDDRVGDAILLGQLIQSVSFFASATMLLIAALVGVLATVGSAYETFMGLDMIVTTPRSVFELKLMLLTAIFVFAFFKFTWAIRQYNYCSAMIGASPATIGAGGCARPPGGSCGGGAVPGGDHFQRRLARLLLRPRRPGLAGPPPGLHRHDHLDGGDPGDPAVPLPRL